MQEVDFRFPGSVEVWEETLVQAMYKSLRPLLLAALYPRVQVLLVAALVETPTTVLAAQAARGVAQRMVSRAATAAQT